MNDGAERIFVRIRSRGHSGKQTYNADLYFPVLSLIPYAFVRNE